MAGESPDRSKQHESSRPTQGSGSPVPDPRVPAGPGKGSHGGVDLATRVLTLPKDGGTGEAGADTERGDGDARRDDAVQASSPEGGKGAGADPEGPGEPEGGSGDPGGTEGAQEAPEGVEEGSGRAAAQRDADEGEGEADSDGSGGRRTAAAVAVAETDADDAGEADSDDGEGVRGGKGDVGIVNSPADMSRSDAPEGKSPARGADSDATEGNSSGAGDDSDSTEAGGEGAEAGRTEAETEAGGDSDRAEAGRTEAGDDSDRTEAEAKADRTEADSDHVEAPTPSDQSRPDGDTNSPETKTSSEGERPNSPAPKPQYGSDDADSAAGEPRSGDDHPVDQPTAIFKAVRPKPNVDQPTTMLKLGDVGKPTAPAEPDTSDEPGKPGTAAAATGTGSAGKAAASWTSGATKKPDDARTPDDAKAPDDADKSDGTDKPGGAKGTEAATGAEGATDAGTASRAAKGSPAGKPGPAETTAPAGKPAPANKPGGDQKPAATDPTAEPGSEPTPKGDAERASTFVALKPLDDPATRKPRTTSGVEGTATTTATTAVPQVGPERTTQQPLPPKPPLDLLAELTNTPPPPPTPLRTLARRVKIWTPLLLLLVAVFAIAQTVRPLPKPTLDLTATSEYTFEGGKVDIPWPVDGQAALDVQGVGTFGSSGQEKPVPIASVAKVMTAYLILRDHPLKSGDDGPKIKIDQAAQDQSNAGQESTVNVTAGDSITQREALESILIASANNVARLLARWDAGSETAFVEKMNAAAKELGMTNTTYTDPSGLNDTTVSTAIDQVKLGKAAMEQPVFREVAAMMSYDDYKGENHSNWNGLVGKNKVVGIKTGTTTSALGNLMFAAKKEVGGETRTIIGAVVRQPAGGPENTILSAALDGGDKLIRAAQDVLRAATILKKGDVVGYVDDGLGGRTPVVVTKDVTAVGWAGLKVKLSFVAGDLPHTAKAGTQVATLTVGDGGSAGAVKVPVALKSELAEPGFGAKLTRVS